MKEFFGKWQGEPVTGKDTFEEEQGELFPELEEQQETERFSARILREPLGRRDALKKLGSAGAGATLAASYGLGGGFEDDKSQEDNSSDAAPVGKTEPETLKTFPERIERVRTGKLAGSKVADLYAFYMGLPEGSVVPAEYDANFAKYLGDLWVKKIEFIERAIKKEEEGRNRPKKIKDLTDRLHNVGTWKNEILAAYEQKWSEGTVHKMGVEEVVAKGDDIVKRLHTSLDWENANGPGKPFGQLSNKAVEIVQSLAERINGKMLVAYSMTELMPGVTNNAFNVKMFDFLSRNAGVEFLMSSPAIHDKWLSLGLTQFTSLAWRHDAKKVEGGSIINKLLPQEERLDGSVVKLDTLEEQLGAAYLFAVYNIGQLVLDILRDDNERRKIHRLSVLIQNSSSIDVGLLQYVASAHHNPSGARRAFKKWLDADMKGSHAAHANPALAKYIRKSNGNYRVLKKLETQQA